MDIEDSTLCWEHDRQVLSIAVKRPIALIVSAIHEYGRLPDGLPITSAGTCLRIAAWWSDNSIAGSNSSAGSSNFA